MDERRLKTYKEIVGNLGFPILVATFLLWQLHIFRVEFMNEFKKATEALVKTEIKINSVEYKINSIEKRLEKLENKL